MLSPWTRGVLVSAATLVAWILATSAVAHAGDPFLCYGAGPASAPRGTPPYPAFAPLSGVTVVDGFASNDPNDRHAVDLRGVDGLCSPAGVDGDDVAVPTVHLEGYRLRQSVTRPRQPPFVTRTHTVTDGTQQMRLVVAKPEALFLRSALVLGPGSAPAVDASPVDDFQCYGARASGAQASRRVTVADAFGTRVYDLGRPSRLCLPADRDGTNPGAPTHPGELLCYRVKLARLRPRQLRLDEIVVSSHNALGAEVLSLGAPRELCVPVTAVPDPAATATPNAVPTPTSTGPTPGAGATLVSISIRPHEIARLPTEVKHFWATGHYSDGGTLDLTNQVVWASDNTAVATAANDPADPNRMDLHVPGTAMISAKHSATGVSSTTSGDDAILHVTGPLQYLFVSPYNGRASRDGYEQFTAIGYFQKTASSYEIVPRNMTQEVEWSVTTPSVATAENRVGDRSRVVAVAPGITGVYVTDPKTGIHSGYCNPPDYVPGQQCYFPRLMVFGDLQTISVIPTGSPHHFYNLRTGDAARVAAVGIFEGGGFKYITQECTFAADNPAIFGTPNVPGDRGVIQALDGGTTNLRATHVATGIVSAPFSHYVYGTPIAITIPPWMLAPRGAPLFPMVPFGSSQIQVVYTHGVGPLYPWEVTTDDPTVATANGFLLSPLKPGVVHAGIRDAPSGVESTEKRTITFYGDLLRVILSPPAVTLRVGGEDQLTTVAEQEGPFLRPVTQQSDYLSSDPTIVAAPNEFTWPPHKSRIVGVAPGTATISAKFDGRSSSDSGDDTFVTVVGDLTTLVVTPPEAMTAVGRGFQFTANGGDAADRTINITQTVNWSSSDDTIAKATNPDGDRSRVDGIGPGVVTVTATDGPSGQTGTATLTVLGSIGSIALLPEEERLAVGGSDYLTAVGIAADGTLNLTQDVTYESDAPDVVAVTNDADARSKILALAPGVAHITAKDALSGFTSSPAVVTVVAPAP